MLVMVSILTGECFEAVVNYLTEDYFVDVVQIYREELKELYENGCRVY